MKKLLLPVVLCFCSCLLSNAGNAPYSIDIDSLRIHLEFYSPHTVRVVKTPSGAAIPAPSEAIVARPDSAVRVAERHSSGKASYTTSAMRVDIDKRTGTVAFADKHGHTLLRESAPAAFGSCTELGHDARTAAQSFRLTPAEHIYGLGNLGGLKVSRRGFRRTLMPGNIEDGIPAIHSTRGYALYWDCFSPTAFSDTANIMTFASEPADAVDYYFMAPDGTTGGAVAEMRRLSGRVPMMPLWTYGFWQSRERYKSQDEICGVIKRYRELGVPLDGIIQDWQYWGNNYLWNAMEFMSPDFPDPQRMTDSIHAMNAHMIISIWSSFGPQTKQYAELDSLGLLFDISTWPQSGISHIWPPRMDYPSGVRVYNCYDPRARDIYWRHLSRLHHLNIDGWWMDSTEPDHFDGHMDFDTGDGRSFRRRRGAYPLLTVGGVHDHQLQADTTRRVFILTRSGWFGQQRYGCNVWTGDVASTWDMLRRQIPSHLNFTMTGNPNVNSDLGGFFCSHYSTAGQPAAQNPQFQELTVRWTQLGVFTPMMRSHGADSPREIYQFGKPGDAAFDALAGAIRLRYSLLPYIYATAWQVTDADASFMRPLAIEFPADARAADADRQFMFGQSLLVAPVLDPFYTPEAVVDIDENSGWDRNSGTNAVAATHIDFRAPGTATAYLPAGTDWYDFFTGTRYRGGRTVTIANTLADIPVFARAGSIIPLGPDVQYASEKPWDELTIRVFPGADGSFTLYEDEGDGYGYTRGRHSTIRFDYSDAAGTLSIAPRSGSFPGIPERRTFTIVNAATGTTRTLDYDGKACHTAI